MLPEEKIAVNGEVSKRKSNAVYHLIDTPEKFHDFLKELRKQKRFALDLETTHLSPIQSSIVGLASSWKARPGRLPPEIRASRAAGPSMIAATRCSPTRCPTSYP